MGAAWNKRRGRSAKDWISKNRRAAIYKRDGHACVYCTSRHGQLSLDHIRTRFKFGGNESTNLVTACTSCNSRRGKQSLRAFCIIIASETNQDWRVVLARVNNQRRKKTHAHSEEDKRDYAGGPRRREDED